jgi:hypothetical protein
MMTDPIFKLGRTLVLCQCFQSLESNVHALRCIIRSLAFVTLMALVWIVLLNVVAFAWWGIIGTPERGWNCESRHVSI